MPAGKGRKAVMLSLELHEIARLHVGAELLGVTQSDLVGFALDSYDGINELRLNPKMGARFRKHENEEYVRLVAEQEGPGVAAKLREQLAAQAPGEWFSPAEFREMIKAARDWTPERIAETMAEVDKAVKDSKRAGTDD